MMSLDTALDLIKEAKAIEAVYRYGESIPNVVSAKKHDECLRIARMILLEHYMDRPLHVLVREEE